MAATPGRRAAGCRPSCARPDTPRPRRPPRHDDEPAGTSAPAATRPGWPSGSSRPRSGRRDVVVGPEAVQLVLGQRLRRHAAQGTAGGQAPAGNEHPGEQFVLVCVPDGAAENPAPRFCAGIARETHTGDSSVLHNAPPSGEVDRKVRSLVSWYLIPQLATAPEGGLFGKRPPRVRAGVVSRSA